MVSGASSRILAGLLEAETGQQLTMSRRWRIETALSSLLRKSGFANLDQLVTRLVSAREPSLRALVVEALLNNETYFFRDRAPFDLLLGAPLARLEQARSREKRLTVWSAGCSTGQEAYSLALAFAEDRLRWHGWRIEIVGTDVSGAAIARARVGSYSQFEVQRGLPVRQMLRWFDEERPGEWRISETLRRLVRFERRSLAEPPPQPGRFDVILCRNVLLYFSGDMRRTMFDRIGDAIADDGVLMLGAGETVIGQTDRFRSDPDNRGLYIPVDRAAPAAQLARSR